MSASGKIVVGIIAVVVLIFTSWLWGPIAVYGPQVLLSKLSGGHCAEGPVLAYIKGESCGDASTSLIDIKSANSYIGLPPECPLIVAIEHDNLQAFAKLISVGADPKQCKGYPNAFFDKLSVFSCEGNEEKISRLFDTYRQLGIEHLDPNELLRGQARKKCAPGVELALARGANPNFEGLDGLTPLHITTSIASESSILTTQLLIAKGANPHLATSTHLSPYASAQQRLHDAGNWPKLESVLLQKKAAEQ